ncbi:MAG TPA: class I SAM-dependent methyltransferase [Thermoplasmata archaeon]|nr:class I SAM-dependent methyltransferase [Thermoplasmata archaeon]
MQVETDADPRWVAGLAGCSAEAARDALGWARERESLYRHLDREHRREGRSSYVEIDAPLELLALVRLKRPRHVIEVGVSSGVSSAYLLEGLAANRCGTLHSVDLPKKLRPGADPKRASWSLPDGRASGWAVPAALRPRWDLRLGDKRDLVPLLAEEIDPIDMVVYDVPHDDREAFAEFRSVDAHFPRGAVAIADHGPGGGLCAALKRWAGRRNATPIRRTDLGLFGFRAR